MANKSNNLNQELSKEAMVEIISQHEIFSGFNEIEKNQLNAIVSFFTVKKKEVIFEIDDSPNHIYFLLSGALTLYFPDNSNLNIKPNEVIGEIGVLNGDFRLGRLVAEKNGSLIAIRTSNLFNSKVISPTLSLKLVRRLSKRVTNYLRSIQQVSSKEIIFKGENEHIEFKSTFRWNLRSERKDEKITHAVLKTIAAFLNSDGGTLMVGVADDGEIIGLEHDRFVNEDKLLLNLTDLIKARLGTLHLENIHYHTERIKNKMILRIDVQASNTPCYFSSGNNLDHFYIRTGPSTTDLRLREIFDFIKKRFS